MVLRMGARPADASAGWCLTNPGFARQMVEYGRDFAELSRPLLDSEYGSQR